MGAANIPPSMILQRDYPGSDDCTGDVVESFQMKADCPAAGENDCCIPMNPQVPPAPLDFERRLPVSFRWQMYMSPAAGGAAVSHARRASPVTIVSAVLSIAGWLMGA